MWNPLFRWLIDRFTVVMTCLLIFTAHGGQCAIIHDLVDQGDTTQVLKLLTDQPEYLDLRDEAGRTPLVWACRSRQSEIIIALVDLGADAAPTDVNGNTALHYLAARGMADEMNLLLNKGVDPDPTNRSDHTPLHLAASADHAEAVSVLLAHDAQLEIRNDYGRTALVLAARETGQAKTISLLLGKGADVRSVDNHGADALMLAAWRGKAEVVQLLLDSGAPVSRSDEATRKLLLDAAFHGIDALFEAIVDTDTDLSFTMADGSGLTHAAAAGGSVAILAALHAAGLNLDEPDRNGWTPLHFAARDDRTEAAAWLIKKGISIDRRTVMGETAFNIAGQFEHLEMARFLDEAGAETGPASFPVLKGAYLGQKPSSNQPGIFAPGIVSSIWKLHSSISFSPDGATAAWAPMVRQPGQTYSEGGIMMMHRASDGKWTPPYWAPFASETDGDVPFFSPDGTRIYFISGRPLEADERAFRERIWYSVKKGDRWTPARPVDPVVNDQPLHWQFSVDLKHSIYFSTDIPGGHGEGDLYRSEYRGGVWRKPVSLGQHINTEEDESTPFISPDGNVLLFQRNGDLWISFASTRGTWTEAQALPAPINSENRELCPLMSPDGTYLFFLSIRDGTWPVWWVSTDIIDELRADILGDNARSGNEQ